MRDILHMFLYIEVPALLPFRCPSSGLRNLDYYYYLITLLKFKSSPNMRASYKFYFSNPYINYFL